MTEAEQLKQRAAELKAAIDAAWQRYARGDLKDSDIRVLKTEYTAVLERLAQLDQT